MSDWDTFRFLESQEKKKRKLSESKSTSSSSSSSSLSSSSSSFSSSYHAPAHQHCPHCYRYTAFVESRQLGSMVCSQCGYFLEPLIDDTDWRKQKDRDVLDERIRTGEYRSIFEDALGTDIGKLSSYKSGVARHPDTRERLAKLARTQRDIEKAAGEIDRRLQEGYMWIKYLCDRHSLSQQVRLDAGALWQARRQYDKKQHTRRNGVGEQTAIFIYYAAMKHRCPLSFRDLALSIVNYKDKAEEIRDPDRVPRETQKLKRSYKIQLRDGQIPVLSTEEVAAAWITKKMPEFNHVPHQGVAFALENLQTYLKNAGTKQNAIPPYSLAASIIYLTMNAQMGLKCTLLAVEEKFKVKNTTISRHNRRIKKRVPELNKNKDKHDD
jgi:transcription initiation factor TFIIIB Brf1 subunit/transcription initiation factor TFIIB